MKILLQYKLELVILAVIILLYFLLRLPNLTLQPIFADEAIYIRWAQIMKAEPTLRFISVTDGKTPLYMWLLIPLFKIFSDPLFAGRFLSIISGFGTIVGVFLLGWRFLNLKAGFAGAFLVAITPFMVFFDRMALVDSMLAAFSVWALFLAMLLIKYSRLDLAMFLGYLLGGGMLTKTPGFFNILVLPVTLVIFNFRSKTRQLNLLKTFGLWIIAIVIAYVIYAVLRLGPGFDTLSQRNQDYIFSPLEILGRPLDPFIPHFRDLVDWFPKLFTIPILILVVLGVIFTLINKNKYAWTILLWGLVPLIIQMALLKTFTARYILFSVPPMLVLAGWSVVLMAERVKKPNLYWPLAVLVLLPLALYFNILLLTDPAKAPLPNEERRGYLEDWTAGYGFPEIAQFLINEAKNQGAVVGTEGSFGTLPDGLQIYLEKYVHNSSKESQITVIGGGNSVSKQLREAALTHPTFFVANKSRYGMPEMGLELVKEFPKALGIDNPQDAILFFRVLPLER